MSVPSLTQEDTNSVAVEVVENPFRPKKVEHTPDPVPHAVTVLPGLTALNSGPDESDEKGLADGSSSDAPIGDCAPGCMHERVKGIGVNTFRLMLRSCNALTAVSILVIMLLSFTSSFSGYAEFIIAMTILFGSVLVICLEARIPFCGIDEWYRRHLKLLYTAKGRAYALFGLGVLNVGTGQSALADSNPKPHQVNVDRVVWRVAVDLLRHPIRHYFEAGHCRTSSPRWDSINPNPELEPRSRI